MGKKEAGQQTEDPTLEEEWEKTNGVKNYYVNSHMNYLWTLDFLSMKLLK